MQNYQNDTRSYSENIKGPDQRPGLSPRCESVSNPPWKRSKKHIRQRPAYQGEVPWTRSTAPVLGAGPSGQTRVKI